MASTKLEKYEPLPGRARSMLLVAVLGAMVPFAVAETSDCASPCQGVELSAGYTADFRRNTTGGLARGNATSGLLELGALWTSVQMIPHVVVTSSLTAIHAHGDAISGDLVGDLQGLNNIEALSGSRLYEAWTEAAFGGGAAWSMRLGLQDLNAEFDAPLTSGFFIGPPFGIGTDLAQTGENGPAVYPVTALGVRIDRRVGNIVWRAAVFDGVPGRPDGSPLVRIRISQREGALMIGEIEYASDSLNKLAFGAWRYTAGFQRMDAAATGSSGSLHGNRGAYAMVDAPVFRSSVANLDAMLRVGVADGSFNAVRSYVGGAMVASKFMAGRPEDAAGVAFAHGRTSQAFRRALIFDGAQPTKSETSVEFTYRTPLSHWLALVPSIQWVVAPGVNRQIRNSVVIGARIEMSAGLSKREST